MVAQLPASQFTAWRDAATTPGGPLPAVLDVREPWELQTASVREDGFELLRIPMREVPARLAELPADRPIACLCHHGMRSMQVARFLEEHGFSEVVNLAGGIDAWSVELDGAVPRY
ncbi:MAG: rhodanese-like domain-containing protein [Pseudomonadota bacterium]